MSILFITKTEKVTIPYSDLDGDINVEDDDEVVEITGGNDGGQRDHLNTRHITPKFLPESGHTSRGKPTIPHTLGQKSLFGPNIQI